ncbi:MAG: FtsW/RodA/SpoVE family cell cycle protein [Dehalococcoidia bacterium]|nr:FtsW/RodA/SpoVE family cell cycle protein [Dehalococcoidia bacterium]
MILAVARRAVPDVWLLLAVAGLVAAGTLMVRAATMETPGALSDEAWRQLFYAGVGLLVLLGASRLHAGVLRQLAPAIYVASLLSLVAVLALGSDEYGARRWIALGGGVTVQPSEFAKIAVVVAVAAYAAERDGGVKATLTALALVAVPTALVVVEPDLGTTLVLGVAAVVLVAAWGVSWRLLGGLGALVLSVLPIAFALAVPDYQRERLAVFLDPGRDPLGSGFTLRQVEIALGGGGLTGRGLDGATSALDGVATRASDFAFAQIGEQMGLLGALLVLALYAVIAWRGLEAAISAPDRFGRMVAAGLTSIIVLQACMHVGVNTRLFPATGIPLPFISTGGSALVGMCLSAGLIQAIAAQAPPKPRASWAAERWG